MRSPTRGVRIRDATPSSPGRGKARDRSYLLLVVIIVLLAGTLVLALTQLRTDEVAEYLGDGNQLVALLVLDDPEQRVSFEVLFADPATGRAALMFVPGNVGTLVDERTRMDALETLHAGGQLVALGDKLTALLGAAPLFSIDLTGDRLGKLVDLLGGVEVFIPNPVDLSSDRGRILLPSGSILLDGDKAVAFATYREEHESAIERAERIHRLNQAVLEQLHEQAHLVAQPSVQRFLYELVDTDLSRRAFATAVALLAELDVERMIFQSVLGRAQEVDGRTLIFPYYDGDLVRETVTQISRSLADPSSSRDTDVTPGLEILNGTSTAGLARRAATLFQSFGYDVLRIDNADHAEYTSTVVLDRRGRPDAAARVADLIGCDGAFSELAVREDDAVDVTIILGGDFDGRRCTR